MLLIRRAYCTVRRGVPDRCRKCGPVAAGLSAEWKSLIQDILLMVRNANAPGLAKDARPKLTDVLTASYSAGVKYMHTFLKTAKGLDSHLREVYDYDGRFSTHKEFSEKLIGITQGEGRHL